MSEDNEAYIKLKFESLGESINKIEKLLTELLESRNSVEKGVVVIQTEMKNIKETHEKDIEDIKNDHAKDIEALKEDQRTFKVILSAGIGIGFVIGLIGTAIVVVTGSLFK